MQERISLVGIAPESQKYSMSTFDRFLEWEAQQEELQLDIETNVTDYWSTRKLITVQFGQVSRFGDVLKEQWALQWSHLTAEQKLEVKRICEDRRTKLIHNAPYELIVLAFYGIEIPVVFDTMLAEKILHGGIENTDNALADVAFKYCNKVMDKSEQTTFGDDILTENKVVYAAADVTDLDVIRTHQMVEIVKHKLEQVLALENEAVLGFSDITFHGMLIDRNKWRENEELAQPVVDAALSRLNAWLIQEPFRSKAIELNYLCEVDKLLINPNSHQSKSELLQLLFPFIPGSTKPVINKYIRDNGSGLFPTDLHILMSVQAKDYQPMYDKLIKDHYKYLVEHGYLLPANTPAINWNSVDQALPLIKTVHPKLKNLSEESLSNCNHPIVFDLGDYKDSLKLISTYGQKFLDNHVEPDGKVRTSFNQIVSTGRVSSKQPNMQNIPAKESDIAIVQPWLDAHPEKTFNDFTTRYRNAFVCEENEDFVDSDFTGQELAIIAHISKDPVWLGAIQQGQDLHSVCAELVYGRKWVEAADPNCAYYHVIGQAEEDGSTVLKKVYAKQKCKCSKHKTLRNSVKSINFGLAYGMGDMKLSGELRITLPEAKALIAAYFKAFPAIGRTLTFLGHFGVKNGFIQTLHPFYRKRWFPFWEFARSRIQPHINGVQYDATLGTIERASKNMPIQGAGADMMKYAMVLVRRWIRANGFKDKIRIVAQVHDQLTTICKKDVSEMWKEQFDQLMQEAARVIIPTGILKADTNITKTWTK